MENYQGRICFVTDLTADVQFRKVMKLGLMKYASLMVSSEEAGREKPHPYIFLRALKKLETDPNSAVMIGDSFEKDIEGTLLVGLRAIWYNRNQEPKTYPADRVTEVHRFQEINDIF